MGVPIPGQNNLFYLILEKVALHIYPTVSIRVTKIMKLFFDKKQSSGALKCMGELKSMK